MEFIKKYIGKYAANLVLEYLYMEFQKYISFCDIARYTGIYYFDDIQSQTRIYYENGYYYVNLSSNISEMEYNPRWMIYLFKTINFKIYELCIKIKAKHDCILFQHNLTSFIISRKRYAKINNGSIEIIKSFPKTCLSNEFVKNNDYLYFRITPRTLKRLNINSGDMQYVDSNEYIYTNFPDLCEYIPKGIGLHR